MKPTHTHTAPLITILFKSYKKFCNIPHTNQPKKNLIDNMDTFWHITMHIKHTFFPVQFYSNNFFLYNINSKQTVVNLVVIFIIACVVEIYIFFLQLKIGIVKKYAIFFIANWKLAFHLVQFNASQLLFYRTIEPKS